MAAVVKVFGKALLTGAGVLAPIYSRVAAGVAKTPAGPVVEKAVGVGSKVVSPLIERVWQPDVSGAPAEAGLEERGTYRHPWEEDDPTRSEAEVPLAPATNPVQQGLPLPMYDRMSLTAVLDALNGLTVAELRQLRSFEIEHEDRAPILDRIDELLDSVGASA